MQFGSEQQEGLDEEIYATTKEPECVMHCPGILDYQPKDSMVEKIKSACLAGTNNPDYKPMPLLGSSLVAYQKRAESLRFRKLVPPISRTPQSRAANSRRC
ncbi:hypothetical protein PC129_g18861 [Phytophthora cactorum]|uniref:Uncharacterized protein n=1 Tax=Phytophthora cactorum TaxID=29920 RepID=A0A329SEZ0_9STRA|nr:hypothetical protein Pcac1_g750 [Phytophthora cactorum]KAG2801422.1 hypothetical protein PC112_g20051 [Phytophthora cactorum]KAG2836482.1 hypothetical protein PC111_g5001 [Phytophthora cactorum]KAG2880788.1 hypothetical protein PC114_g21891 [Phytophthora cactorum]KAG2910853.1 hypothetical protein PC117_g19284 [Phytophthora cactorum]